MSEENFSSESTNLDTENEDKRKIYKSPTVKNCRSPFSKAFSKQKGQVLREQFLNRVKQLGWEKREGEWRKKDENENIGNDL